MNEEAYSVFKAIADPTRREIIGILLNNGAGMPINKVVEQFDMTRQAVTKHLKILKSSGLIEITKVGREKFCMANPFPIKEMHEWTKQYEKFWNFE